MNSKIVIISAAVLALVVGLAAGVLLSDSGPEKTWKSIVYDGNGGDCDVRDDTHYDVGDTADIQFSPVPTKSGYIFMGWSEGKADGELVYDLNRDKTTATLGEKDLKLYAVYKPDPARLDVGSYMKLDAKLTAEGQPNLSCVGYFESSIVSVSGNSNTVKTVLKLDLLDGIKTIDSINQEDISESDPDSEEGYTVSIDYGNYLYKGKSIPVCITEEIMYDDPGVVVTSYTDLYENIMYCVIMDYASEGLKFTFELNDYDLKYSEPKDNGKYNVFYDGNGGICSIGDGNTYNPGEEVDLTFTPAPFKEDYLFCGWSTDKDAKYPEYDNYRDLGSMKMGSEDVTLYAVYSKNFYNASEGSSYEYRVTERFSDDVDYLYEMEVKVVLTKVYDEGMVFKVTGTETVTDNGKSLTEKVDMTYDTYYDYWGYENGEVTVKDEGFTEMDFRGSKVPGYVYEYEGIDYMESTSDYYGFYDDILYLSEYSSTSSGGVVFNATIELTGYDIVYA